MTTSDTAVLPPRFLVSFQPKRIAHRFTDILVLGSGLAGLRAALAADPTLDVVVVTKDQARSSNSSWAQGGIAAVWDPEDRFEFHFKDTIVAGKGLCDEAVVDLVVRDAPGRIQELIDWGAVFDKAGGGKLALTLEGGHSAHRIIHALGDATGHEVIRAVLVETERRKNVEVIENRFSLDLLTEDGRCVGALTATVDGSLQAIWAKQTILATGGCGQVYRETTNPAVATGDGLAMAYRANAQVQDMEFMQFHPTVLYVAGSARHLISEAVRGEGAYLRDRFGHRFMAEYDARGELAPRDVVAKAIVAQMAKTRHPCVYLDQSHLDPTMVRERFPGIVATCAKYGLDFTKDGIPVRPGAHYMVGGVTTDHIGQTTLPGLWACGEVAATGLHGANRLASNSLLEAIVFGALCGEQAGALAKETPDRLQAGHIANVREPHSQAELDARDIRNSLASLMFRDVGIERTKATLEQAHESVDFWCQYVMARQFENSEGWELQNMLTLAGLIIRAATERTETRGVHNRSDFPDTDDANWRCHQVFRREPFRINRLPV